MTTSRASLWRPPNKRLERTRLPRGNSDAPYQRAFWYATALCLPRPAAQPRAVGLDDGKTFTLNEKAVAEDAVRDGYFGVVTNVADTKADEVILHYKTLWIVEDAFGEMKGTLKARPVFHWTDQRIMGHLTLCFLAYLCEALMTKALREKKILLESPAIDHKTIKPRALTVAEAMRELQEVRAIPVNVRSTTMWVRNDINGNAAKLFSAVGLKAPPRVLHLTKSQNPSGAKPNHASNLLL